MGSIVVGRSKLVIGKGLRSAKWGERMCVVGKLMSAVDLTINNVELLEFAAGGIFL